MTITEISDGNFLTQHSKFIKENGGSGEDIRKSRSVEPSGGEDIRKSGSIKPTSTGGAPGGNGEVNHTANRAIFSDTKPAGSGAGTGEKIGSDQPGVTRSEPQNPVDSLDFDRIDQLDFISTAFSDIPKSAPSTDMRNVSKAVHVQTDLTRDAVANQLRAMSGVQNFEIGVRDNKSGKMFIQNLPRDKILCGVAKFKRENVNGADIYIRPDRLSEHPYLLLDDLDKAALSELRKEGFGIALVVESSPNNFQAVLKMPAALTPDKRKSYERALQKRFNSDFAAADGQHFFRLAGFTNRKSKHIKDGKSPYCKLTQFAANAQISSEAWSYIVNAAQVCDLTQPEQVLERFIDNARSTNKDLTMEVVKGHEKLKAFYASKYDPSTADYKIVQRLVKAGYDTESIKNGLLNGSPNLQTRKSGHVEDYVLRTIDKVKSANIVTLTKNAPRESEPEEEMIVEEYPRPKG